jgi:succinoglycan biosynthesis transport protein ExoP
MSTIKNSIRDFLYVIFKRKKIILWIVGGVLFFTLFLTLIQTPMYSATSKIYIRGAVYDEALFGQREINPAARVTGREAINTEISIITSYPVCEKVVTLYGLQNREIENPTFRDRIREIVTYPRVLLIAGLRSLRNLFGSRTKEAGGGDGVNFQKAVKKLQSKIEADPVAFSKVVSITYSDRDPKMAADITNAITDEYLNRHLEVNINKGKSSFYKEQLNAVQERLALMEDQFSKFKSEEEIISYDDQEKGIIYTINSYNKALSDVRKEIISQRNELEKIKNYIHENPDKLIPSKEYASDPIIQQLQQQLVAQKLQLADLKMKYTDENRYVIETKDRIRDYEKQIKEEVAKRIDLEEASLDKLVAEESALLSTIARLNAQYHSLPKKEITYKTMESSINLEKELLKGLREKYEQAIVEEASDSRSRMVKVIEYGKVPLKPSSPKLFLNLILALLVGPVMSLTVIFGLEYFDHTVNTPEDAEHYLDLRVLGSIKEVSQK